MEILYPICDFLQRRAVSALSDWGVTGVENVPPWGPLIIVSNHLSQSDPSFIGAAIPRRPRFLAKKELFANPIAGPLIRSYGGFPLNRQGGDLAAYRWAMKLLERDGTLVLFPEGTRSPTGLRRARDGATRIALASQAPLLPVGITGTENFGTWARVFFPNARIRVNIGRPFTLPHVEGKPSREVLGSLTDMLMQRIAILLPPEYRGEYGATLAGSQATN
jgi:1-acyl-sn-glycerol-3-phosphate acyltransferase